MVAVFGREFDDDEIAWNEIDLYGGEVKGISNSGDKPLVGGELGSD